MSSAPDLIVVGAGIVGAACAAACAQAGLKVLVVDGGPVGSGTTAAGMGHLVVMDDSPAQFALTHYSRKLWQELAPELPADVDYDPCGTLWVAADEQELAEVRRKQERYSQEGVRVETLDAKELSLAEPNLRRNLAGGLRVVEDAVIYPPCAARFLVDQAKRHGAQVRLGQTVTALLPEGGVRLSDGSRLAAGRSLNATGHWCPHLNREAKVRPRKGHLLITDRHPGFVHHQIVELGYLKSAHQVRQDSVAFNIQPRKNGQMLLGSSRQFGVEDTVVEQPMLARVLRRALEYLPELGTLSGIRAWTGHRAATPDKLPLIGPSRDSDRVWLAAGHEGLGITTSLGTGRLVADLLTGRPTGIPAEPYAPGRFTN